MVDEQDIPRFALLMQSDWEEAMAREGLAPVHARPGSSEDPEALTCPACGATEPLVDGACPDCGLVLG